MALVRFNVGGDIDITVSATTGTDLTVTIDSRSYTTAGQASAADTASFFVSQWGQTLAKEFGIFVSSSTTTLTLNGIKDSQILVTSGGTLGSADATTELGVDFNFMLQYQVASLTSLTINLNASSFSSSTDVLTLLFLNSKDRKQFIPEMQKILNAQETNKAVINSPIVCSATLG